MDEVCKCGHTQMWHYSGERACLSHDKYGKMCPCCQYRRV